MGFELMILQNHPMPILVRRSIYRAIKPHGEMVHCEFIIYPMISSKAKKFTACFLRELHPLNLMSRNSSYVLIANLKSLTYLALIPFLSLLLCVLITIIFCLGAFVTCFQVVIRSINTYINTQLASQYRSHFCRTNIKQFSILYRGPKIWNWLPIALISSPFIFV